MSSGDAFVELPIPNRGSLRTECVRVRAKVLSKSTRDTRFQFRREESSLLYSVVVGTVVAL